MATPRIIFVQGPNGAGKDTAGEIIARALGRGATLGKFAAILREETCDALGIPHSWIPFLDAHKEDPTIPELRGKTWRQNLIHESEQVKKPEHGKDYYGQRAKERYLPCLELGQILVFTDSRFKEEAVPLMDEVGIDACAVLRISRPLCEHDAAVDPIVLPDQQTHDVLNDSSMESLREKVLEALANMGFIV